MVRLLTEINIDILHKLCENRYIKWTTHVLMKLQERDIHPSDIKNCIMTGEIIEYYPNDYPYPSCLTLGLSMAGKPLHVVIGIGNNYLWIITAYYPAIEKWNFDFKTRKEM